MYRSTPGQPKAGAALRILLVDPHSVYRRGLRSIIAEAMPGTEILEAGTLNQGLADVRSIEPVDVLLVDLDQPSFRSVHLLKQAFEVSPKTRFAIISGSDTRQSILASLAAGFHGFISKQQPDGDILQAIRDIASGRIYVPPTLAETEAGDAPSDRSAEVPNAIAPAVKSDADLLSLTPRQREVLSHLALGRSNKEIAQALHIAEATTKGARGRVVAGAGCAQPHGSRLQGRQARQRAGSFRTIQPGPGRGHDGPGGPAHAAAAPDRRKAGCPRTRCSASAQAVVGGLTHTAKSCLSRRAHCQLFVSIAAGPRSPLSRSRYASFWPSTTMRAKR